MSILCPLFSGLFAPYWDMYARGVIVGLTRYVNRARYRPRHAEEAICYQSREVLEAMQKDSGIARSNRSGWMAAAVKNNFLMQLQAAHFWAKSVIRPKVEERRPRAGRGLCGGFGYGPLAKARRICAPTGEWIASLSHSGARNDREEGYHDWKRAVQRAMNWLEK